MELFCRKVVFISVAVLMTGCFFTMRPYDQLNNRYTVKNNTAIAYAEESEMRDKFSTPTVVIVALPQSGSELLQYVFKNATDFLFLPFEHATIPIGEKYNAKVYDPCYWPQSSQFLTTQGWFKTLSVEPLLFLNNHPTNPSIEKARRKFRKLGKNGCFVLDLSSGFWNSKLPWIFNAIGISMQTIVVVRDPRSWVYSFIQQDHPVDAKERVLQLRTQLIKHKTCHPPTMLPSEFRNFKGRSTVEKLAEIWNANIATMIRNGRQLQIVRFEDLVLNPEYAATSMMQRLRMTIAVPEVNKLSRAVQTSEHQEVPLVESIHQWKDKLSKLDTDIIESICHKMMEMLGYL